MLTFDHLWQLLADHGSSPRKRLDAYLLWGKLSPKQQQQLYDTISTKLRQNRFVHYDPVKAIIDNARPTQPQILSYGEYYATYRTTEPKDGWTMLKNEAGKIFYSKSAQP